MTTSVLVAGVLNTVYTHNYLFARVYSFGGIILFKISSVRFLSLPYLSAGAAPFGLDGSFLPFVDFFAILTKTGVEYFTKEKCVGRLIDIL